MSMIDTSNKKLKDSPFSDLASENDMPRNPFEGFTQTSVSKADYLTTRSAIFTAFIAAAVCFMVPVYHQSIGSLFVSLGWTAGSLAAYILFWSVSLRFFENPDTMPLSAVLNLIPAAVLGIVLKDKISFEGTVLIAAALTSLTILTADDNGSKAGKKHRNDPRGFTDIEFLNGEIVRFKEFDKADVVSEILIPSLISVAASSAAVIGSFFLQRFSGALGYGIRILTASFVFMLISFAVSKIRRKDFILSSVKLSDSSFLPSTEFRALRSFFLRRLRFLISFILVGSGCLLSDFLNQRFSLGMPYIKYILSALLVFAFAFIRGRNSEHLVQFLTELYIICALCTMRCSSISDLLLLTMFSVFADIIITSLLFAHNRRLIMSSQSPYISGMPLELMSVTLVFMACEILFSYFGVYI